MQIYAVEKFPDGRTTVRVEARQWESLGASRGKLQGGAAMVEELLCEIGSGVEWEVEDNSQPEPFI